METELSEVAYETRVVKNKTILLVDDDKTFKLALSKALQKEDYLVIHAKDGKDGLSKLKSHDIDLVITDYVMPNMDGLEFVEAIKNDERYSNYKDIPIIMNSGMIKANKIKELGISNWLAKPIDLEVLLIIVKKNLRDSQLRKT